MTKDPLIFVYTPKKELRFFAFVQGYACLHVLRVEVTLLPVNLRMKSWCLFMMCNIDLRLQVNTLNHMFLCCFCVFFGMGCFFSVICDILLFCQKR